MSHLRIDAHPSENQVDIYINGEAYTAYEGDTVLAALVASGHKSLRHSRKIGEPRGPLCGMGVCYECLVTINKKPHQRACMTEVEDRMEVLTGEA
ncbi:MAG TPA: (2Fe-2S)-binding protein [Deltaproteobacteria bacterium]|nr:(2Fe-2S)-binding protein [Deltaproteobacteria bacterium]